MRNEVEGSGLGDHGPSEQGLPWGSCLYRTFVAQCSGDFFGDGEAIRGDHSARCPSTLGLGTGS